MSKNFFHISSITRLLLIVLLVSACSSCRVVKHLDDGDQLLVKNEIELLGSKSLNESELQSIIKQKPNTKLFFFFRFNAWLYGRYDRGKLVQKRENKQQRLDRKNKRKIAKGKDPVNETSETWRDRLIQNIGEKPVVYDSLRTITSSKQLEIYLRKSGYFSAHVEHELKQRSKRKIISRYKIETGPAHKIEGITWVIPDSGLVQLKGLFEKLVTLKKGDRFSVEKLDESRESITSFLNNQGYYKFSKEYIRFEVDTLGSPLEVHLNVLITNKKRESNFSPDSLVDVPHKKYIVGRIEFHLDYDPLTKIYEPTGRILNGKFTFEYIDTLGFYPDLLENNILIEENDVYRLKNVSNTYKKLRNLEVFNYINIQFEEEELVGDVYKLKCHIYLKSGKNQSTNFEITGTHRDGIWGANLNSSYRHNNLFSGAESFNVKFLVGAEAVRPVSGLATEEEAGQDLNDNLRLNSLIIGPEITMSLHKLVFLPKLSQRFSTPQTEISGVFNYQIRPDFERSLAEINFGWKFRESSRNKIYISPFNFSVITITKSDTFEARLSEINDLFLINSYQDHLIPSFFNGNWEFSNQTSGYQKRYAYNRFGVESVGLNFRLGNELFGKKEVDENGSYTIEGIRFAQYLKFENDFRFYTNFSRNQSLANRVDFGYALPYANSKVLPFEKNFFAGGANGIRAWQARSLGPGSYQDTTSLVSYNNLGEVRLTLSSEYRFDLTNILEGAFFIDAGNVWIVDDEDNKEGSEFKSNFISDIAVGGGIGFRFDFDFFLIRLDLGFKLKDPSLDRGEKWFWESKNNYDDYLENLRSKGLTEQESYRYFPNINLGIGYPF